MSTVDLTTSTLVDAREALQTAIVANVNVDVDGVATDVDCYLYGSANLVTPCVVIEPNGWAPSQAGQVVAYTVNVTCLYNTGDLATSSDGAEELARQTYLACRANGWLPVEVPAPTGITWNERAYVGVQFTVGTHVTI